MGRFSWLFSLGEKWKGFRSFNIFFIQAALIAASAVLTYLVRFDRWPAPEEYGFYFLTLALVVKLPLFQIFNLFRGWWRYTSLSEFAALFKALSLSLVVMEVLHWLSITPPISRSVFVIDFVMSMILLGGARLGFRMLYERDFQIQQKRRRTDGRVLIIGAGEAGLNLVRHLRKTVEFREEIVGFLDDAKAKWGASFNGLKVLGGVDDLVRLVSQYRISEIYIAIPSLNKSGLKRIAEKCIEARIPFKMIPSLKEMLDLGAKAYKLREVRVDDLLGREPIALEKTATIEEIHNSVILVSGAGGSIGAELCRQISSFGPRKLILLERSEYNLFQIKRELIGKYEGVEFVPVVADITDRAGLAKIFATHKPQLVYHAAAHKHVFLMQMSPREAVRNNVFGTRNLAEVSSDYEVKKFVMISTDKAVNPLSIMGYSKRMAELVIQSMSKNSSTSFMSVRFGNVLGSSGSVVEIFRKQIDQGGPVTITHPDASRFFITTPEAVELVLHAGTHGKSGHIYMLDMGDPIKVMDLARKMIQLADPEGKREIKIKLTGLKPGEKINEELIRSDEDYLPSSISKVFVLKNKSEAIDVPYALDRLEKCLESFSCDIGEQLKLTVDTADGKVQPVESSGLGSSAQHLRMVRPS